MSFKDLHVWQRSCRLSVAVYQAMAHCKDYGFKDQVTRSALSMPSNIAEGYDRQTNKAFVQFLYIAKGSCAELETQVYIGREVGYINQETADAWLPEIREISAMLGGLIKSKKTP